MLPINVRSNGAFSHYSLLLCCVMMLSLHTATASTAEETAGTTSKSFPVAPVEPSNATYTPLSIESIGAGLSAEVQAQVDKQNGKSIRATQWKVREAQRQGNQADKEKFQSELDGMIAEKKAAGEKIRIKFEFGASNYPVFNVTNEVKHAMIATVVESYNKHLPLELSPNDFWVLIAQGVAQFLGGNPKMAEKYRHQFVEHEGKKQLVIIMPQGQLNEPGSLVNKNAWPILANKFRDLIAKETATNLSKIITSDFSTTGDVERVVFSGTLMETMKNYFEYKGVFSCGIPKITLHGTTDDYRGIISRLAEIKALFPDLDWWVDRVVPRMEKIAASVSGTPDQEFWRRMVLREPEGSGGQTRLTGWIGEFVPFVERPDGKQAKNMRSNLDDLPYGISFTDVLLQNGMTGEKWQVKLSTGFLGSHQNAATLALRPAMGWMTFYDANSVKPAQA